ncbi:MAG: UDP-N-acetylmuramoyl-L-alanyl-D-glutamate--2,6-diaminopimelate ligase [Deltaproteobacteria bacterium]|jgi:UDP-N-acetylmuramoyl-L-alanyl-D-glutamate--2,6-diaminopimelate ligase|nr:UDP-N-acetylmuramoyl-L-alanyl-D-glutamate--2,6-diaminopimelate ligase [Deltaproteobacteria bacterium]
MDLSVIMHNCQVLEIIGPDDVDVSGLCCDSRLVKPGDAFFAIRGSSLDGHEYAGQAVQCGASALILEEDVISAQAISKVLVPNSRLALAKAAQAFYGDPTQDMEVVGVTGTNGKTTVTYLLESILECSNLAPAVIGTINYRYKTIQVPAPHTTPESHELMEQLVSFKKNGARSLVMEVSSHALSQYRADGVCFDVAVFTNLTPEHLDYHLEMEHYYRSKCRLFHELLPNTFGYAVVNIDDSYGYKLAQTLPQALTCGQNHEALIRFQTLSSTLEGIQGMVTTPAGMVSVESQLIGDYNIENILCAIGAAVGLGLGTEQISEGIRTAPAVPGRLEMIENNRSAVILVDYAHTPDALRRVIGALKKLGPQRILTVFGCGGDRDRSKRPVMGEVAVTGSDISIATSDNPRTECPQQILKDIRRGLNKVFQSALSLDEVRKNPNCRGFLEVVDRREAIRLAVSLIRPGDLLLVAGKGHEDYQILGRDRIHFDDREELRKALQTGDPL